MPNVTVNAIEKYIIVGVGRQGGGAKLPPALICAASDV